MEIWLDSTNLDVITKAKEMGLLFGITTNPSIVSKQQLPVEELIDCLLNVQEGPVAVQVVAKTASGMIEQAKDLFEYSPRLIIKIPAIDEGFKAIATLTKMHIPTMATTIIDPLQALLGAQAGSTYLAPYLSRMGETGMEKLSQMQKAVSGAKILVASIRTPEQVFGCALAGIAAVTINDSLFQDCTDTSEKVVMELERFDDAWKTGPGSKLMQ